LKNNIFDEISKFQLEEMKMKKGKIRHEKSKVKTNANGKRGSRVCLIANLIQNMGRNRGTQR
jgi:hypothetical protein